MQLGMMATWNDGSRKDWRQHGAAPKSFRTGFCGCSFRKKRLSSRALSRLPLARSGYSYRCGHLHPLISGMSMPFLYA